MAWKIVDQESISIYVYEYKAKIEKVEVPAYVKVNETFKIKVSFSIGLGGTYRIRVHLFGRDWYWPDSSGTYLNPGTYEREVSVTAPSNPGTYTGTVYIERYE